MKNYVRLILFLCVPLFISISCDKDEEEDYLVFGPKADIDFKGKSLQTVKDALQGTWYLVKDWEGEYTYESSHTFMSFKDDKIKQTNPNSIGSYYSDKKWRDIIWGEGYLHTTGELVYTFYGKPDYQEGVAWLIESSVPFEIKDNILKIGNIADDERARYYSCIIGQWN